MPITHSFVSAIADDPAAEARGEVLPSHWNESHEIDLEIADINGLADALGDGGAWTPTLTCETAGDLNVSYTLNTGSYMVVGDLLFVEGEIVTSDVTQTTASGDIRIAGLPAIPISDANGSIVFSGLTKSGVSSFAVQATAGEDYITINASGSGVDSEVIQLADI